MLPSKQMVELHQFAPLPFPTHPTILTWIPDAFTVEEIEGLQYLAAESFVELFDAFLGLVDKFLLAR